MKTFLIIFLQFFFDLVGRDEVERHGERSGIEATDEWKVAGDGRCAPQSEAGDGEAAWKDHVRLRHDDQQQGKTNSTSHHRPW